MTRPGALVAAALVALALIPATAPAQQTQTGSLVDEAAGALQDDPVFVHPDADPTISDADEAMLERRIGQANGGPIYIAVMPEEVRDGSGGDTTAALVDIGNRVARDGVYALVAGGQFRAVASSGSGFERGAIPTLANDAFETYRDEGIAPTLANFVDRVGEARQNGGEVPGGGPGAGGFGGLGLLAALAGGLGLFALLRRRRVRRETEAQVGELRENVREDLIALGNDIRALDIDIEMPDVDPAAKEDYGRAVERYTEAERRLDLARDPDDFAPIGEALEEGRWAMASAKARLERRPPPERRPPCFFDPRHGPSTREVEWAPDGYQPRPVPVCEADALRIEEGETPMAREIMAGGRRVPLYDAPAYYSPYAGGFFGGFTGFLPGLLFGSMLGSSFGGFGGFGGGYGDAGGFDGGGDFGGGDFGGFGGFGGGDFGGGDF